MSPLVYCIPLVFPLIASFGLIQGGLWVWLFPAVIFGSVPLLELGWTGAGADRSTVPTATTRGHRWALYMTLPLILGLLTILFVQVSTRALVGVELIGALLGTGLVLGGLGINVAHELGHGRSRKERLGAKILLSMCFYMHFFIEHNRGHHRNVATDAAGRAQMEDKLAVWMRENRLNPTGVQVIYQADLLQDRPRD